MINLNKYISKQLTEVGRQMKELAQILGITTESMIEQFNDTMEKKRSLL
ncbi:hypothetical protein ACM0K4_02075 [Mycoplasma sp. VS42A]